MIRSDHLSGSKKGGVCVCYKEHIPPIGRNDFGTLSLSLVSEIRLKNKMCFLTHYYRSPSQTKHEFEHFCTNLDTLTDHRNNELPFWSVINGDLNARYSKWCNKDMTNSIGFEIDTLTSARYKQMINKLTHIINNSSSCIDLIFCNNLNLIYGIDLSLFGSSHHNIVFDKKNIPIPLPLSHVREVRDYSTANAKNVQKAVRNLDWEKAFQNLSDDKKVDLLNKTLLNIFKTYIPNKNIKFNYCQPPWMNEKIRYLQERSKLTELRYKNG